MKFRTKLFYSFIALGVMSTLLALFIIYGEASRLIFEEIRSKILSLVTSSEKLINPEILQDYIESKGEKSSSGFKKLSDELIEIRNLNRRSDVYVERIYLIKRDKASGHYYYLLDIQNKHPADKADYGEKYPFCSETLSNSLGPFVTTHIYSNKSGSWLTGYAPIYSRDGKEMAFLGIDVQTGEIYIELEKLLLYGLIAFAVSIFAAAVFAYFLSKLVSSSLGAICDTVKKIGKGDFSTRSTLDTRDEFNELSLAINCMSEGLEERERLKLGFARYVSQYALEELLKMDKPISLQGERKKVTLLFSDIRHFTGIAEDLPPEEVLKLLNEYFTEMIEVVFNYGGTLDKFIGDGMMIEFGAPLEDPLQELHATLVAIHMQLHLDRLSGKWEKEGKKGLNMGIGIHTGLAVIGNIGSELRMEYTAIGDAVNVASKLERFSKKIKKPIIVSKAVYEKVKNYFTFEDLEEIKIPGRKGVIQAYSLNPHIQKKLHEAEQIHKQHKTSKENE